MYTRYDYMTGTIDHHTYYDQFGKLILPLVAKTIGVETIVDSVDEHFNDIPLRRWDGMHSAIARSAAGKALREANGGGLSLSDTVCTAKAAARIIRDAHMEIIA